MDQRRTFARQPFLDLRNNGDDAHCIFLEREDQRVGGILLEVKNLVHVVVGDTLLYDDSLVISLPVFRKCFNLCGTSGVGKKLFEVRLVCTLHRNVQPDRITVRFLL